MVSKDNSFWGCSRFLKYRSEQVQIHTEEAFWRWITTYMKEVEKRPVICQGDYGSNEWMGMFSRAKIHIIFQTYWIEYRTSLNSLRSCTPEHSANQLFLYLHIWPSLAPNFLSLNNLTVQNFNNSHTLSVNFCSSYMLLLLLCPGMFFFSHLCLFKSYLIFWLQLHCDNHKEAVSSPSDKVDPLFFTPRAFWNSCLVV